MVRSQRQNALARVPGGCGAAGRREPTWFHSFETPSPLPVSQLRQRDSVSLSDVTLTRRSLVQGSPQSL